MLHGDREGWWFGYMAKQFQSLRLLTLNFGFKSVSLKVFALLLHSDREGWWFGYIAKQF